MYMNTTVLLLQLQREAFHPKEKKEKERYKAWKKKKKKRGNN